MLKSKVFVLLIVGQAETTYQLSLELVNDTHHELDVGEGIHEYLLKNDHKKYKIVFPNDSPFE